jgi:hypothetical protein
MNAIITAATGYSASDLHIFLWSVAKNCKNTTVFLIAYRRDRESIERLQDKYPFIQPIYIGSLIRQQIARLANYRTSSYCYWLAHRLSRREYSFVASPLETIGRLALRIPQERFFIALQLVRAYRDSFSKVLLTDSRDVVIQRDPFQFIDEDLVSSLEPETIGKERYTSKWIEAIYGREILHRMLSSQVVCSGVTFGRIKEVENYLSEMCKEMWRLLPKIIFAEGCDQAFHDYLIFDKQIAPALTDNQRGLIATVSLENPNNFTIDFTGGMVKVHDKYPAIIHQYDRHPDLLSFFKELATEPVAELSAR